jgi:rhodanese-related sulfurtransferase
VLLSSARTFEAGELPADKSTELVFYCGSQQCNAAPKAATRAKELGYTAVKVMPEGIRGWVQSGKPVSKLDV